MLWLKFLLAACAIAFCIGLGYLAAHKYRCRRSFYSQLYDFNERYLSELGYARKPLPQFLKEYVYAGEFGRTIGAFSAREELPRHPFLSDAEQKEYADYFAMLGKGDAQSQSAFFTAKRAALQQRKEESEKEAKARGALYLKLGLLAGLAFVILII